ncbi:hypothetical protein CU097_001328 [Rhizopus azygosporus]|uniref:Peptidase S59 domain-containing protein n=1 Tax=Rhizopus azygosporus TaxID=86630 RepID=A0A367JQ00_RHIAZ|nr:hypothetical protein CU097_001328 [Rhizopus azygosporus]
MFGKSTFGTSTGGFGQPQQTSNVFGQQPQQPQQPSAFGGFGATSTPNAFGAANTGSAFGQPAQQQQQQPAFGSTAPSTGFGAGTSAFGQPKPTGFGGFGSTSTPAFGSTQPATTGFGGFGSTPASNTSAFGSTSTSTGGFFGQRPATGGFGSTPTTTAFGQPQQQQQQTPAFGGFGSGGTAFNQPAAGANQGTAIADFTATQDRDITTGVNNFFQTITAMPQYKDYSLEELRLQDYVQGRKTASAFGAPAAGGAFGQTTSTMGGGAFGQPSTGGAFGQPAASTGFGQPAQSNMFGATANTGGMFGQQQQQQQQQPTTAFGQSTGTNAFGSTTNAFGATGTGTTGFGAGTTGGAFGASAAKPFGFGGTSTAPTTGFGATTTGFGQQGTTGGFGQQNTTGGFGQQAGQTSGFGGFGVKPATTTTGTTGFGGFGNTGATTGGFGTATSKPATGFSFGQPATSTGTTGFGGFGASTTPNLGGFGQTGAGATTGAFGGNKPATSTSFFGNTTGATTGTTGFGGFGTGQTNTTGGFGTGTTGGLLGQKPAGTLGGSFTSGGLGGTGFGSFGQQQQTGAFNLPGQGGLTTFATTGPQNGVQQQPLIATVDKNPYGNNPLFDLSKLSGTNADNRSGPSAVAVSGSTSKPSTPHFPVSPRVVSKIKLRGFSTAAARPTRKTMGNSSLEGISDDAVLGTGAFAPRDNNKKLVFDNDVDAASIVALVNKKGEKKKAVFDPNLEYVASKEIHKDTTSTAPLSSASLDSIHPGTSNNNIAPASTSSALAIKNGYYVSPTLDTLKGMSKESLKSVQNLVVGRTGFGEIRFEKPVDLSQVDLDDFLGNLIVIDDRRVVVYPDEATKKPAGTELNVPAVISIENCFSHDKYTGAPIRDPEHPRFKLFVDKMRQRPGVEFVSYDNSTGTWSFRAQKF